MQKEVAQLQLVLQQLIAEHEKLLAHLSNHQAAMKKLDLPSIDQLTGLQDASRMRIAALDGKRELRISGDEVLHLVCSNRGRDEDRQPSEGSRPDAPRIEPASVLRH